MYMLTDVTGMRDRSISAGETVASQATTRCGDNASLRVLGTSHLMDHHSVTLHTHTYTTPLNSVSAKYRCITLNVCVYIYV